MKARLIRWLIGGEASDLVWHMLVDARRVAVDNASAWALRGEAFNRDAHIAHYDQLNKVIPLFSQQDWA